MDSEEEAIPLATHHDESDPACTRSRKIYLKNYSKVGLNKGAQGEPGRQKELHFQKNARKDDEEKATPFQFDIIA